MLFREGGALLRQNARPCYVFRNDREPFWLAVSGNFPSSASLHTPLVSSPGSPSVSQIHPWCRLAQFSKVARRHRERGFSRHSCLVMILASVLVAARPLKNPSLPLLGRASLRILSSVLSSARAQALIKLCPGQSLSLVPILQHAAPKDPRLAALTGPGILASFLKY